MSELGTRFQLVDRDLRTPANHRSRIEGKARQAAKLAEIREALVAAGHDTTAKQAVVLGVCRATAWVVLNRDKRTGPSAKVIKRILSSPNVPLAVRRKVEEYIEDRSDGSYGHCESATRAFSNRFHPTTVTPNFVAATNPVIAL
jgi:hypothetical protein